MQSIWRYGVGIELMNVVDFGHLVISPKWFKNIEIARGPAGLMWGSGAEAGLINFNLRDDLQGTEVSAEYGNYNRQTLDFMYGHTQADNKKNSVFIGYHTESQDAQVYKNALVGMGQASNNWKSDGINPSQSFIAKVQQDRIKVIFFQDHDKFVAPVAWFGGAVLQNALEASMGSSWGDEMEIESYRVEYSIPLGDDKYSLKLYNDYYTKQWSTQSVALDTQRKRALGFNSSALLADDKLDINFGGDLWGEDQTTAPSYTGFWVNNATYGINWYNGNLNPTIYAYRNLFLQGKYTISDQWKVLLGARTDFQKGDPTGETINSGPRIGLFYVPNNTWTFKYLYNSTARRPQANEAGSNVSPETLGANELIASAQIGKKLNLDLTLFSQGLSNEITRNNNPALLNSYYNTSGLTTSGFEWALKYAPAEPALIYWNGSYDQSKVNNSTINGVVVSEAHNADNEPLFVPAITSYIGAEYNVLKLVRVNVDLRSIMNIPYQTLAVTPTFDKKSAQFVDLTLNSKKFCNDSVQLSFTALNIFDNEDPLPAYGEHIGNAPGLIPPEGMRYYVRATIDF
jgi:outer membrane receptor protein involved in Fe transport